MKKIYKLLFMVVAAVALTSCADNDYSELDKGCDQLMLTSDQQATTLNEKTHANEAVAFSWTTGNNNGTGHRIYYQLELAPKGSDFQNAYVAVNNETQVYAWSVNQENLNNIILDKFNGVPGQNIELEARISAISEGVPTQIASVDFAVIPYQPVTETLYLIGDATPTGWSADHPTVMTRVDNGKFSWEGNLVAGDYKFITTQGQFLPSYNNDGQGKVIYRSKDDDPDEKFHITESHYYRMTVDLLDSTLLCEKTDGQQPDYDQLFFVGDATGWNFEEMTKDPLDPFLFRYGKVFDAAGEFKFGTASGSWENMFKAVTYHQGYTDPSVTLVNGFDPDNKWYLNAGEAGKAYKICFDIRAGKERMMMKEFKPYEMIYLVGDATPNGWDLGNATAMTATTDPMVFTWTGNLQAGELKFSLDKQSDWNGAWLMCASGNDVAPTGNEEHALLINKSDEYQKEQYLDNNIGDVDQKWKITSSGTYTITVNQLKETVTIVKQ